MPSKQLTPRGERLLDALIQEISGWTEDRELRPTGPSDWNFEMSELGVRALTQVIIDAEEDRDAE